MWCLRGSAQVDGKPQAHRTVPSQELEGVRRSPLSLAHVFANPPLRARPQIRFWTPGAAVTDSGLRADIGELADLGFGGFEIVAFAPPKGIGPEYAWGSGAWNRLMNTVTMEAGKRALTVDFTNGAKWPIAMPSIKSADAPGALYEMTYGSVILQPGQHYEGAVPQRRRVHPEGTPKLDAVLAFRQPSEGTLDASSVIDVTPQTKQDTSDNRKSTVDFTAPPGSDSWVLFSFWEQPSAQKSEQYYVIDHFSVDGAKASNDYWEKVAFPVLGRNMKHMQSIFDDSLEYAVSMEWTKGMREAFKQQHGYDIMPFMPFVGLATTYPRNDIPGYRATDEKLAAKVEHDYRETLTTLYVRNHLQPMEQIAERHGLTVRYQVAYNKPMQIEDSALAVGIPETEALGRSSMDMPRYMAGAVHLTGKPFYSIETSAEFGNAYGQSLQDILWWSKRAWAGGVNMQHFHGESYSGQFDGPGNVAGQLPGQSWPGYSAFANRWSNNWTRQTSSELLSQTLTYMARVNYVLQKKAKVDLAVYDDSPDVYNNPALPRGDGNAVYPDRGILSANGFSYDFVSPALLNLPQATVTKGFLNVDGPAYKALVIPNATAMTMGTVERLKALASSGLVIVFVGEPPARNASHADELRGHSDADIRQAIEDLLKLSTVARVTEYAAVPATLRRLGCRADAEPETAIDILTQHRVDSNADFYYLYNYNRISDADATSIGPSKEHTRYPNIDKTANFVSKAAQFSLAGTGKPYLLDPWSGVITPIPQFTSVDGHVRVRVQLEGDQAILIGVMTDQQARRQGLKPAMFHVTESDADSQSFTYAQNGDLLLKATQTEEHTVRLSDGALISLRADGVQHRQRIQDWSLTINAVEAPSSGSILFRDSSWKTVGTLKLGSNLRPWREIDASLEHVSGIGSYTGTFQLNKGWNAGGGAYLYLGDVDDSFTVFINGNQLPPQDPSESRIDLGPYTKGGLNTVLVKVSTTLYNTVITPSKTYGLRGNEGIVMVQPYQLEKISPVATTARRP
jgi:hypothetical protein